MIEYLEGNIFDSPAQVIVNTVNTVGVMGKGLALEYKNRYPKMFEEYRTVCEKRKLAVGKLMLWRGPDHWVLLFPTKENWRNPSKLEYIEKGLYKFVNTYAERNISSIAFPKLGCGNGELDWKDVKPLMEKYLKPLPIDIYIYLGKKETAEPEHKKQYATMEWMRSYAKDLSFNGVKDDIICNSGVLPIEFKNGNEVYTACWEKGLVFSQKDIEDKVLVKEDEFFEIWDDIRKRSVFEIDPLDKKRSLIYAVLFSLGYITEIRLQKGDTLEFVDGYQLNEGTGRVFSLRGNE